MVGNRYAQSIGNFNFKSKSKMIIHSSHSVHFDSYHVVNVQFIARESISKNLCVANFMIQAPGGVGAIFKGQSMVQAEVAAFLGRWKGINN